MSAFGVGDVMVDADGAGSVEWTSDDRVRLSAVPL